MARNTKNRKSRPKCSCDRRVLMICHAFPPTGGSGVQRSAKFAKYLPDFGWQPTVWTAGAVDGLPRDPSLSMDLPREVVVHAHRAGGGVHAMRRTLRGFIDSNEGARLRAAASHVARAIDWRLQAWLAGAPFPDDCAGWARRSLKPLLQLIEAEQIQLIYSTFSPASNHWLALQLKRRTGLPWVADFRDLWTDDYRYHEPSEKRRIGHRQLEEDFLNEADVVIGVTPRQTALLAERITEAPAKFITITNGYDPADFEGIPTESSDICSGGINGEQAGRTFVVAYVGRLDAQRTSKALWEGLAQFGTSIGSAGRNVLIRFLGHVNAQARDRIASIGLPFRFEEYAPHGDAIRAMCDADALLLIAPTGPNCETVIAAKIFEYLAARRPIILVGPPDGECERIVRECKAGVSASLQPGEVAAAFRHMFDAWQSGQPLVGCSPSQLRSFSRIELTRKLATVFDELVEPRQTPLPRRQVLESAVS